MRRVSLASAMPRRPRQANWATPIAGQQRLQEFGDPIAGPGRHPAFRAAARTSWRRVSALSSHWLQVESAKLAGRRRRARSRYETNRLVRVLRPRSRKSGPESSPHVGARMAWSVRRGTRPKAAAQRCRHSRHRCNQTRTTHGGAGSCSKNPPARRARTIPCEGILVAGQRRKRKQPPAFKIIYSTSLSRPRAHAH